MMHPIENSAEISQEHYFYLMHDLSLAGANNKTPYGSGWTGLHPEFGSIAVSRVKRPARVRSHPPYAYFVKCSDVDVLAKVKSDLSQRPPLERKIR